MASYTEIATKLQEDFRRLLKESGEVPDADLDPVIKTLFWTIAHRIDSVASFVRQKLPSNVLDYLIQNLGIPVLRSQPAQTVVRFHLAKESDYFERFTKLVAYSSSGDKLIFHTD